MTGKSKQPDWTLALLGGLVVVMALFWLVPTLFLAPLWGVILSGVAISKTSSLIVIPILALAALALWRLTGLNALRAACIIAAVWAIEAELLPWGPWLFAELFVWTAIFILSVEALIAGPAGADKIFAFLVLIIAAAGLSAQAYEHRFYLGFVPQQIEIKGLVSVSENCMVMRLTQAEAAELKSQGLQALQDARAPRNKEVWAWEPWQPTPGKSSEEMFGCALEPNRAYIASGNFYSSAIIGSHAAYLLVPEQRALYFSYLSR